MATKKWLTEDRFRLWVQHDFHQLDIPTSFDIPGKWKDMRIAGVSILRYINISILIKYSNFSGFYKKLGPFYKKNSGMEGSFELISSRLSPSLLGSLLRPHWVNHLNLQSWCHLLAVPEKVYTTGDDLWPTGSLC